MKNLLGVSLFILSLGLLFLSQNSFAKLDTLDTSNFSSPAAQNSYNTYGNVNTQLDFNEEVDSIFSNDGAQIIAYRSAGCSTGCSSGCSVGCSSGCSVGCSSGCSVGCRY